jgi:AAHS family 4-hydroxybenzoate transporter-like MFS transporter
LKAVLIESPRYLAKHPARWPELRAVLRRLGHAVSNTVRFRERVAGPQVRSSITSLLTSGLRKDTIALWTAYVTCMLAVYLGFNWIPSMLTGAGLSPTVGSAGITAFNLGGVVGSLGGAFSFARFGSRVTMVVMALGAATGAFVLSSFHIHAASAFPVVTLLGVTGGLINAVQVTMFALAAQLYPWQIRSTGVGTASAIGRLGAIMSSYVGAWTLEIGGSRLFFLGIAAAMIAAAASLAAISRHIRPHTR